MKRAYIIKTGVGIDPETGRSRVQTEAKTKTYLYLSAGEMYDYEILYVHSTHMTYENNCDAHLKLTWAHSVSE